MNKPSPYKPNPRREHPLYYFAIVCPPEINKEVEDFKKWLNEKYGCKSAMKSPAHITLVPPFPLTDYNAGIVMEYFSKFRFQFNVPVDLSNFSSFGKNVLFAQVKRNPELTVLKTAFENYICKPEQVPVKPDKKKFHPHVTIATRDIPEDKFKEIFDHFSQIGFKKTFKPDNISMLKLVDNKWEVISQVKPANL